MPAAAPVTITTFCFSPVAMGDCVTRARGSPLAPGTPRQVTVAVPQATAVCSASGIGRPSASAWTRPAANTSPAPVVSTTCTRGADTLRQPSALHACAPCCAARDHHPAQRVAGDREPVRPGPLEELVRQIRLRADEHRGRPRARGERRHVRDDQRRPGALGQQLREVEVAAAHVDRVRLERPQAHRRAALAAAVQVDDRALAERVEQHQRARALAGHALDRRRVDAGRLYLGEQPLADRVGAHRRDQAHVVPGVAQRDRGIDAAAAEAQLALAGVEVVPLAQRLLQPDDVVLRGRADHHDVRHHGEFYQRSSAGDSASASAACHSLRLGTRPLSWA